MGQIFIEEVVSPLELVPPPLPPATQMVLLCSPHRKGIPHTVGLLDVPVEIIIEILKYLSHRDLLRCQAVRRFSDPFYPALHAYSSPLPRRSPMLCTTLFASRSSYNTSSSLVPTTSSMDHASQGL